MEKTVPFPRRSSACSALAGLIDWSEAPPLPFELACFPSSAYKWINLPVARLLPALIALGIVQHTKRKLRIPGLYQLRQAAIPRALRKLGIHSTRQRRRFP